MITYYAWIGMLTSVYTSFMMGRLVKKGYTVGRLSLHKDQLVMGNKDAPSQMLALQLDTDQNKSVEDVIKDVVEVIERVKVKHHGIIVVEAQPNARWAGSNISLSEISKEKTKKQLQRPRYLTLVPPVKKKDKQPEQE